MSARSTFIHLAAKAGILFGALFLVSVLLAAIPGHHAPAAPGQESQQSSGSQPQESQPMDHSKMSGMDMDDARVNETHAALNDCYKIFLPNLPQPEYHFTNYWNGFLEGFSFDPGRPTSLLYRKTATGYELVGAMYTMPKRVAEDQLDARV